MEATRPSYALERIETMRDRLHRELLAQFQGQVLQTETFSAFVTAVGERLPRTISRDAVFESCRCLLGRTYTPQESLLFAWRLAGNMSCIREGRAVFPWTSQRADEWVPVQVLRALRAKNRRGAVGADYTFRVLAGTPAGMQLTTFWKTSASRLAALVMGFSRFDGKYPFKNARELVGLRCYALIEQARSAQWPWFFRIDCPTTLVNWNREQVLKMRARVYPCPRGFTHACYLCAVGFTECPAGTHRMTYERGFCSICGNPAAFFDPEDRSPHCIDCTQKERMRRQT